MEQNVSNVLIQDVTMEEEKMGFVTLITKHIVGVSIVNSIKLVALGRCAQHVLDIERIQKSSS